MSKSNENDNSEFEILGDDNHQFDFTFKIIVIGNAGMNKDINKDINKY